MEINGLIIESVVGGSVGTNCYIVHKKDSEHCFVVDPGDSGDKIANYIRDQKMILDHILLTHGHFDHIQGVRDLKMRYDAKSARWMLRKNCFRMPA